MSGAVAKILADINQLSASDYEELSRAWDRLRQETPTRSNDWDAVIERRVEEIRAGKVQGIPSDEAFARLQARRS